MKGVIKLHTRSEDIMAHLILAGLRHSGGS